MIENSKVMKNVLNTLLKISRRKDTDIDIVSTMDSLVKKLEGKYGFLKHVEINDTRFFEAGDSIIVMSDLDSIPSTEMGKAIHDIIFSMIESLGRDAGFYFLIPVFMQSFYILIIAIPAFRPTRIMQL